MVNLFFEIGNPKKALLCLASGRKRRFPEGRETDIAAPDSENRLDWWGEGMA